MRSALLGADRVVLLLSLVPYLREHGPVSVTELAETFDVPPSTLKKLIGFLGTAGIPGETLSYQHNDLFDIDWDAFLEDEIVSLTHTVAIDETPRFTGAERAALIAGLHELSQVLSEQDADIARQLASRLGAVLGGGEPTSVSSHPAEAAGIATLVEAIEHRRTVLFDYVDREGNSSARAVDPRELVERQGVWYLSGFSHEREADRTFRIDLMREVRLGEEFGARSAPPAARQPGEDLVATVPERLLGTLRGFEPEIIDAAGDGLVRIRITAWHPGAAVRLVQHAPGEIVVESPASARASIEAWAAEALAASREAHSAADPLG